VPDTVTRRGHQTHIDENPHVEDENILDETQIYTPTKVQIIPTEAHITDITLPPTRDLLLNLGSAAKGHIRTPLISDNADAAELEKKLSEVVDIVSEMLEYDDIEGSGAATDTTDNTKLNELSRKIKEDENDDDADATVEEIPPKKSTDILFGTHQKLDFEGVGNHLVELENDTEGMYKMYNHLKLYTI
jgi:hypothetical protein